MSDNPAGTTDVWKSATLILVGIVISLVACIWNQNRDMATKQDLVVITTSIQAMQTQVNTMSERVAEMHGEDEAKKAMAK